MNELEADRRAGARKRGLGMGLSALLGGASDLVGPEGVRIVPIEFLRPSALQPRRYFGEDELAALTESIRARGVMQPAGLLSEELATARAEAGGPIGVNFLMPFLDREAVEATAEHARVVDLESSHVRITVRMTSTTPRHVPERVAHLAADEQRGVDEQAVSAGGVEDGVEPTEVGLVVAACLGFDRLPKEVDAHRVESHGGHPFERTLERVGPDPPWPVGAFDGDHVRPHGQDRPTVALQVVGSPNDRCLPQRRLTVV